MKKFITILTTVIMVLAILTSCSTNSSETSKGNVTNIEFNALFKGIDFDKLCSYALIDHEYTSDDYTVYATYSSGEKENVTAKATIEGEHVKSSAGSLIFSGDTSGVHEFKFKVSYGGKSVSAVVYAYKPGEAIEFVVKQSKFFAGNRLTPSIAGIKYLDKDGDLKQGFMESTASLSGDGIVVIKNSDGTETKGTLREIRTIKEGDTSISYSVYEDSEVKTFNITVIPLSEAKSMKDLSSPSVKVGDSINTSTFVATYMKNYKVSLGDEETFEKSTAKIRINITEENGTAINGATIDVSVTRNGQNQTTGTFQKDDKIKIVVNYKISETKTLTKERTFEVQ